MGGLVGRAAELAELADLVDRARRGEGGAMLIGGEPGIGKTRLAEAAAARAGDAGLASRGAAAGRATARHPSGRGRR